MQNIGILPRCFKISKIWSICNRDTVSTWYSHHWHEYKLKLFWALTRSSHPAVVVEYIAIPDSKVAEGVEGSEGSHFHHWHVYRECPFHAQSD